MCSANRNGKSLVGNSVIFTASLEVLERLVEETESMHRSLVAALRICETSDWWEVVSHDQYTHAMAALEGAIVRTAQRGLALKVVLLETSMRREASIN